MLPQLNASSACSCREFKVGRRRETIHRLLIFYEFIFFGPSTSHSGGYGDMNSELTV